MKLLKYILNASITLFISNIFSRQLRLLRYVSFGFSLFGLITFCFLRDLRAEEVHLAALLPEEPSGAIIVLLSSTFVSPLSKARFGFLRAN